MKPLLEGLGWLLLSFCSFEVKLFWVKELRVWEVSFLVLRGCPIIWASLAVLKLQWSLNWVSKTERLLAGTPLISQLETLPSGLWIEPRVLYCFNAKPMFRLAPCKFLPFAFSLTEDCLKIWYPFRLRRFPPWPPPDESNTAWLSNFLQAADELDKPEVVWPV